MNIRFSNSSLPQNPIAQFAAFLLAGVLLIGVVFMGFVILAVLLGVGAVLGLIFSVRLWWLRRKLSRKDGVGQSDGSHTQRASRAQSGRVIEVEYSVVEEDDSSKS